MNHAEKLYIAKFAASMTPSNAGTPGANQAQAQSSALGRGLGGRRFGPPGGYYAAPPQNSLINSRNVGLFRGDRAAAPKDVMSTNPVATDSSPARIEPDAAAYPQQFDPQNLPPPTPWFGDDMEKSAVSALMRHLAKLGPKAQAEAVKGLPKEMRTTAAYKLLGEQAARTVTPLPNATGHGAEHIFNVTRRTQSLLGGAGELPAANIEQRRAGTLSALLHDVGRAYENPVVDRASLAAGRPVGIDELSPHLWHSETGGRYARHMLRQSPYTRYVPGLRTRVRNNIRVHDTDAHGAFPALKDRVLGNPGNRPARAVYAADKLDGMGLGGVVRTGQTGEHFGQTVAQSAAYGMDKNINKYNNVINNYVPKPMRPEQLGKLQQYEQGLNIMKTKNQVPSSVSELQSWMPKAAGLLPRIAPYAKLFRQTLDGETSLTAFNRIMMRVAKRFPGRKSPTTMMRDAMAKAKLNPTEVEGLTNIIRDPGLVRLHALAGKILKDIK